MRHIFKKRNLLRLWSYFSVSPRPFKRYLDHFRYDFRSFAANQFNIVAMDKLIDMVEVHAPESLADCRILDIGCGDGYILGRLKRNQQGRKGLLGLSVCRGDIKRAARTHGVKVKFGEMHSIPVRTGSIDTIIARHCLEHSMMPMIALLEMYRVLDKQKGLLVVVLPANTPFWVNYPWHYHCMPRENWVKLFDNAGFDISYEETGTWFATATQQDEEEWRFLLRPKTDPRYAEPALSIGAHIFRHGRARD